MGQVIVGLAGYAGSGKDTIAALLGWERRAFADQLKAVCRPIMDALGVDPEDREQKEKVRNIYVEVGRTARKLDPDFWVKRVSFDSENPIVFTDVRYENEARKIMERGGLIFFIHRPGVGPANEEERQSLQRFGVEFGYVVHNIEGHAEAAAEYIRKVAENVYGRPLPPIKAKLGDGACCTYGETPEQRHARETQERFLGFEEEAAQVVVRIEDDWRQFVGDWNLGDEPDDPGCWRLTPAGEVIYIRPSGEVTATDHLTCRELIEGIQEGEYAPNRWPLPKGVDPA